MEFLARGVPDDNAFALELDDDAAAATGKVFSERPQPARDEAFNEVAGEALDRVFAEFRVPDPGAFQGNGNFGGGSVTGRLRLGTGGWRGRSREGEDGEDGPQRCRPAEAKRSWDMDEHGSA